MFAVSTTAPRWPSSFGPWPALSHLRSYRLSHKLSYRLGYKLICWMGKRIFSSSATSSAVSSSSLRLCSQMKPARSFQLLGYILAYQQLQPAPGVRWIQGADKHNAVPER